MLACIAGNDDSGCKRETGITTDALQEATFDYSFPVRNVAQDLASTSLDAPWDIMDLEEAACSSCSSMTSVPTLSPPPSVMGDEPASCVFSAPQHTTQALPVAPSMPLKPAGPGFVNVFLLVDPMFNKVTLPQQILECEMNGEKMSALCGPTELPGFPIDAIQRFTNEVVSQATPTSNGVYSAVFPQQPNPVPSFLLQEVPLRPTSPKTQPHNDTANTSLSKMSPTAPGLTDGAELPPTRALTAYNFFFRDERERLLSQDAQQPDCGGDRPHVVFRDLSERKKHKLLSDHWNRDRTVKRRHRKSHGKISFAELSRRISTAWNGLDESSKAFYQQVAQQDYERFQSELHEYNDNNSASVYSNDFKAVVG
jgi:hypothetical protein